jgi:outer membrane protein OmpA-like peptidoglycan-associated protein
MNMRWLTLMAMGALAGCATVPPPELQEARVVYGHASQGPAPQLAPAEMQKARLALQAAERSYADAPKAEMTRDLAYAATRSSEVAEAAARQVEESRRRALAQSALHTAQREMQGELSAAQARVQLERLQREQAVAAMQRVQRFADVREEARGKIITLNGSVLFTSGTAVLLPTARQRLDEVAEALQTERGAGFLVAGFTDSSGSPEQNLRLSQARADAVRTYLIDRGVSEDRIQAVGRSDAEPIATNATAEGRANNRRVEIIVRRHQAAR